MFLNQCCLSFALSSSPQGLAPQGIFLTFNGHLLVSQIARLMNLKALLLVRSSISLTYRVVAWGSRSNMPNASEHQPAGAASSGIHTVHTAVVRVRCIASLDDLCYTSLEKSFFKCFKTISRLYCRILADLFRPM